MFLPTRTVRTPCTFPSIFRIWRRCLSDDAVKTSNPFYSKYAKKIRQLQERDPDELQRRLSAAATSTGSELHHNVNRFTEEPTATSKQPSTKEQRSQPGYTRRPTLEESKVRELKSKRSIEELTDCWKSLHLNRNAVCAVLPRSVYDRIRERAADYPVFLYPLPRDAGYEFVLSQFLGDQCHMTPLAAYQRHGSESPACLALTFWTDLLLDLDATLMSGEYDPKLLGPVQAQCLVNQMQLYYAGTELRKKLLLWNFNREPQSFKHEQLVREFEHSLAEPSAS